MQKIEDSLIVFILALDSDVWRNRKYDNFCVNCAFGKVGKGYILWTHGDIEPVLAACIQLTPRQTVLCDYVIEAVCVVFSLTLETIDMKQKKSVTRKISILHTSFG